MLIIQVIIIGNKQNNSINNTQVYNLSTGKKFPEGLPEKKIIILFRFVWLFFGTILTKNQFIN